MDNFILLTLYDKNELKVLVGVASIIHAESIRNNGGRFHSTNISLKDDGEILSVTETPEKIYDIIKAETE